MTRNLEMNLDQRKGRKLLVVGLRIAVPVLVLLAWTIAANRSDLVPSIGSTLTALIEGFQDGKISSALGSTMNAVLVAFAIATVVGVVVGMALGRSVFWSRVFEPVITTLFAVPRFILYPVLLAIYGVGLTSKIWMGVLSAVFPILINSMVGAREVHPTLVKMGRSVGCAPLQMLRSIYLPAALPVMVAGVRLGFSLTFLGVVFAELFAAASGLGLMVIRAYSLQQYPLMFAVVVLIGVVASIALFGIRLVEQYVQRRTA